MEFRIILQKRRKDGFGAKNTIYGAAQVEGFEKLANLNQGAPLAESLHLLSLSQLYVELKGQSTKAFNPTLRLGSLDIQYSPYVVFFEPWQGFAMSDCRIGPIQTNAFYSWSGNDPVWGAKIAWRTYLDSDIALNWSQSNQQRTVTLEGTSLPFSQLLVTWLWGWNENKQGPFRVETDYNATEQVKIRTSYRNFPTLAVFDPLYRDRRLNQRGLPLNPVDSFQGQQGYTAGVTVHSWGLLNNVDLDFFQQERDATSSSFTAPAGFNRRFSASTAKIYSWGWGSFSSEYSRVYHLSQAFWQQEDQVKVGVRFNSGSLSGLELGGEVFQIKPMLGVGEKGLLGTVSYQSSGLSAEIDYDFGAQKATAAIKARLSF